MFYWWMYCTLRIINYFVTIGEKLGAAIIFIVVGLILAPTIVFLLYYKPVIKKGTDIKKEILKCETLNNIMASIYIPVILFICSTNTDKETAIITWIIRIAVIIDITIISIVFQHRLYKYKEAQLNEEK